MIDIKGIDFSKPTCKNATHTLDTRVLDAITNLSTQKDCSKSDVVNKILLKVFGIN